MATIQTGQANGWRGLLAQIANKKRTLATNQQKMDQFTVETISGEITGDMEKYYPAIADGAVGEYKQTIKAYQDTGLQWDKAYSAEINRWDSQKLNAEIASTRAMVELALSNPGGGELGTVDVSRKLEAIYNEAKASGDPHKQRGAFEVLRALKLDGLNREEKLKAFHVSKAAESDLASLRTTQDMQKAKQAQAEALNNILLMKDELIQTAEALGQGSPLVFNDSPFSRALNMVQVNRQTGEVFIYPEDSIEVTGHGVIGSPVMGEGGGNVSARG